MQHKLHSNSVYFLKLLVNFYFSLFFVPLMYSVIENFFIIPITNCIISPSISWLHFCPIAWEGVSDKHCLLAISCFCGYLTSFGNKKPSIVGKWDCCTTTRNIQYSSGKRTKKLFIPNIGVSRTCQKHSESNRVNVIFGGHHSQVRRMYALCEVMRSYSEWKYYTPEAIFLAKRCEIPRSNLTKYLSDFYIFIYLFNKVI